jgi:hypothetical protein
MQAALRPMNLNFRGRTDMNFAERLNPSQPEAHLRK